MIASSTAAAPQGQAPTSLIHRIAEVLDADPDVVRR